MKNRILATTMAAMLGALVAAPALPASAQVPPNQACATLPFNLTWSTSPNPLAAVPIGITLTTQEISVCESLPGAPTTGIVPPGWNPTVYGNCALAFGGDATTGWLNLFIGNVFVFISTVKGVNGGPGQGAGAYVGTVAAGTPCSGGPVTFAYLGASAAD